MASIFTWESDTPRVASPWLAHISDSDRSSPANGPISSSASSDLPRLQAEPQEGPVEYKLHLLLRPRRKFRVLSTGSYIPGPKRSTDSDGLARSMSDLDLNASVAVPAQGASTQQTRQHRLQQLTTQLLWRLQQSSPHHTSSATNIIFPAFPDASLELLAPQQPGKLLHGLEESEGALYEIGVSDDGTLVGLAEDELQESLNNLRAMAACLGCTVQVLRKQAVGNCQWLEERSSTKLPIMRQGALYVAEALVKPYLQVQDVTESTSSQGEAISLTKPLGNLAYAAAEQLRITLTGPTMSGKSTLLGTLTTSTLDSGRGKSRLSLLKHRHEITSGITSSVTQEVFGYADRLNGDIEVVNYATENIASWIDIHAASAGGRLVFVSDSAGHPRYRRTTVRSLVGWAPHWTVLCIPANATDGEDSMDQDLAGAQLDLCLRLGLPLVVAITKLDLASRTSLKGSLSKVLDALKAAGRKASIFPNAGQETFSGVVSSALADQACNIVVPLLNNTTEIVPIVLTSAVQGTGISNLHALLHELPLPVYVPSKTAIFHIEDAYSKPNEVAGIIVSGHLRSGEVAVGDTVVLGPFSTTTSDDSDSEDVAQRRPSTQTSRSFPGALHVRQASLAVQHYLLPGQEWKHFVVSSIRNLRLPTHTLVAGQVGTIAIVSSEDSADNHTIERTHIRKGMILSHVQPSTTRTFVANFDRQDLASLAIGYNVVVYIASIRASAKVVSARAPDSPVDGCVAPFDFDEEQQARVAGTITAQQLHVTFSFESGREFIMLDDQVLVMPGGGPKDGLAGFVGRIVELVG